jgi:hypothetical protein
MHPLLDAAARQVNVKCTLPRNIYLMNGAGRSARLEGAGWRLIRHVPVES